MNVGHVIATSEILRVLPSTTLEEAYKRMREADSLGLAVMDGSALVGVLSRRDIGMRALTKEGTAGLTARDVMRDLKPLDYDEPIETALDRLVGDTGLVLPVNHFGQFAGLVTWAEVGHFVREVMQLDARSPRVHLALVNAPGQLARVLNVLARERVNVLSVLLSEPKVADLTHVVLKVEEGAGDRAAKALRGAGLTLLD